MAARMVAVSSGVCPTILMLAERQMSYGREEDEEEN
jgi:hypothetical protein